MFASFEGNRSCYDTTKFVHLGISYKNFIKTSKAQLMLFLKILTCFIK